VNQVVQSLTEGNIVRTLEAAGYAFVHADGDVTDIFLHRTRLRGLWPPPPGARVRFQLEKTTRGLRAVRAEIVP
jgi:cold shock CspA family protein